MSGQYKVAWLCEALLVSRSGYYHWVERRRQPNPRQLENIHLRERIRAEFARSRQTYASQTIVLTDLLPPEPSPTPVPTSGDSSAPSQ